MKLSTILSVPDARVGTHAAQSNRDDLAGFPGRLIPIGGALLIGGLALLLALVCFTGVIASDDLLYSHFANQIAEGTYSLTPHHMALRFGLLLPVAAVFHLFGISEPAVAVVPLLASTLNAVLVAYLAYTLLGPRAATLAAALWLTFPLTLRYATILVPEPLATTYMLAALVVWLRAPRSPILLGSLAGLLLGVAYLTREVTAVIVPVLLVETWRRRQPRLAAALLGGALSVVAAEQVTYLVLSGDPMFRSHAMTYHEATREVAVANSNLPFRLFLEYPRQVFGANAELGLHAMAMLAVIAAGTVLFPRVWQSHAWLAATAGILFAYLNFGTSSLTRYLALPAAPRYLYVGFPFLVLIAVAFLDRFATSGRTWKKAAYAGVCVIAISGVLFGLQTRGRGYYTRDVRALRAIAARVEQNPQAGLCVEAGERLRDRWTAILFLLTGRVADQCSPDALVVTPDASGRPVLKQGRQASSS